MLKIIDPSKPCDDLPKELATTYSWSLDPFQQHAIAAIHRDENVLVTAKTGSGKTLVGEYQIHYSLAKGKRVFYTTPIKSLSNQKFQDLKKMFPSVGILTGDIKFKPDAQVVVMTTEILRNMLYKRKATTASVGLSANISLDDVDAVIFDEVHYINNVERGKVWEETLILLPPEVRLILLSATLAAPEEFASWIGTLKQRVCVLISTLYRVVPLTHYVLKDDELVCLMDEKERYNDEAYKGWLRWLEGERNGADKFKQKVAAERASGTEGPIGGKVNVKSFMYKMNAAINLFDKKGLLPALFFVFSRKDCERYAAGIEATLIDSSDTASVIHIIDFHLHRYDSSVRATHQYHQLRALLVRGIAYHHSGLLPLLKEIVEILFAKGFIKVMFCTETFAVGINMPTKTAVFLDYHKYDNTKDGLRCLYTDEYLQMAGRAGRRGLDKVGTVVYLPQRRPAYPEEVRGMMKGSTRSIQSRMDFHYDFLLKILQSGELKWLSVLKDSYWFKQRMDVKASLEKELLTLRGDLTMIESSMTEAEISDFKVRVDLEAKFAASVNAARKDAQRGLDSWKNKRFGPRWTEGWAKFQQMERMKKSLIVKTDDIRKCDDVECLIEPRLRFLVENGYLKPDADVSNLSSESLTLKGILATEVNESHSLLTSEIYVSGLFKGVGADVILTVLASFINEKLDADLTPQLYELQVDKAVIDLLAKVDKLANKLNSSESSYGIPYDNYWDLSLSWVEPVWRWLKGENSATICTDYGIYEGNLMRTVLRIANVADEWINLATYCEDTEMVSQMSELKGLLLREIAVTDSLYLRI
jgi:superfamily II RNA helicase